MSILNSPNQREVAKKIDPEINEMEDNDVRDKRERLVACVLSGNPKMYLGKEYIEEQINKMDCNVTRVCEKVMQITHSAV